MRPFEADATSFGRHETFHLRFGWLTKGFDGLTADKELFSDEEAMSRLGVGKNMVHAIHYWMIAAQIFYPTAEGPTATAIGNSIFSKKAGWDRYVEDDATLWLLHWLIASNARYATSIYWFFNRFHKPEFTARELLDALTQFVNESAVKKVSSATLKRDATLLLRMYEPSVPSQATPLEEALDSPLSTLDLVHSIDGGRLHHARAANRWRLPIAPFGYAVAELFEATRQAALPFELLLRGGAPLASPGLVFRLNEEALLRKLEELVRWLPDFFELRETAGVHQIYMLSEIAPLDVLKMHYLENSSHARAAA